MVEMKAILQYENALCAMQCAVAFRKPQREKLFLAGPLWILAVPHVALADEPVVQRVTDRFRP